MFNCVRAWSFRKINPSKLMHFTSDRNQSSWHVLQEVPFMQRARAARLDSLGVTWTRLLQSCDFVGCAGFLRLPMTNVITAFPSIGGLIVCNATMPPWFTKLLCRPMTENINHFGVINFNALSKFSLIDGFFTVESYTKTRFTESTVHCAETIDGLHYQSTWSFVN